MITLRSFLILILLSFIATGCLFKGRDFSAVSINNHEWRVELARTPDEQMRGLSERLRLATSTGMLFLFDSKSVRSFWMKDMKFPLDIIWIKDNKIVKIDESLRAEGEQPENIYSSAVPVDRVLEINSGEVRKFNIKVGNQVNYVR